MIKKRVKVNILPVSPPPASHRKLLIFPSQIFPLVCKIIILMDGGDVDVFTSPPV